MLNGTVGSNPTLSAKTNAQIAQSVEQGTENPRVGGSIPPLGTKIARLIYENYLIFIFRTLSFILFFRIFDLIGV